MKTKLMEIVQQCRYLSEEKIREGIESNYILYYCYIKHNKDVYAEEDIEREHERKKKEKGGFSVNVAEEEHNVGDIKEDHWHIYLRLKYSADAKYIARLFGVEEQYVNKVKGGWNDVLLYCIHKNRPEKYQYDVSEVISNFDFADRVKKAEESKIELDEIIALIDSGELREFNYTKYITMITYTQYETMIKRAFNYRAERMLQRGERDMKCIYIQGESGSGKTTYAKMIAKERGMSFYVSSGSNDVLDGYKGQDCLILDDLRPSCMGLSDLLKMLDNNTASTVKSRYRNKTLECKLVIITTVLDIDKFFNNVFTEQPESAIQLYRRCEILIKMNCEMMNIYTYDKVERKYTYYGKAKNPVDFVKEKRTAEETKEFVNNFLSGTVDEIIDTTFEELTPVELEYNPFEEKIKTLATGGQVSLFDYL